MKKSRISLFVAVLTALCCAAPAAFATQGFYGYVYSHASIDYLGLHLQANSKNVSIASVVVTDVNGQYVTSTTSSACGYYSVSLPSMGYYTLTVTQNWYHQRELNTCSASNEYESLTGHRGGILGPGLWAQLDLATN